MNVLPRRHSFLALLGGLFLLASVTGCGSSNPNISAAEDALEGQQYEAALQSVNTEIQANPQNAGAYRLKGDILLQQAQQTTVPEQRANLFGEARAAYDQAIEIDPSMNGEIEFALMRGFDQEFRRAAGAYNRADSLQDPDMFREAATYFDAASRLQPDSSRSLLLTAESYISAGDYGAAIEPLERAVEVNDETPPRVYRRLGQLYLQEERTEEALTLLEGATGQYPDDEELRSLRLAAIGRTGDADRALNEYAQIVEERPDNAQYRIQYGTLLLQNDRFDEAIAQLERASELEPDNVGALFNRAAAYRNKAVPVTERIREIDAERSERASELSREEIDEMNQNIQDLNEQRRELFRQAVGPLERALEIYRRGDTETNLSEERICRTLYTAYVQTDQTEQAMEVEDCAGLNDED